MKDVQVMHAIGCAACSYGEVGTEISGLQMVGKFFLNPGSAEHNRGLSALPQGTSTLKDHITVWELHYSH